MTDWNFDLVANTGGVRVPVNEDDLCRERECLATCDIAQFGVRYFRAFFESSDDTEPS